MRIFSVIAESIYLNHSDLFQEPHGWLVDLVNRVSNKPPLRYCLYKYIPELYQFCLMFPFSL